MWIETVTSTMSRLGLRSHTSRMVKGLKYTYIQNERRIPLTAVYPGSFDPVTYGHLNIIERAASFSERLIVGVLDNPAKTPLLSVGERVDLLSDILSSYRNVSVCAFSGLLTEFARLVDAQVVVKGLRNASDFDYEHTMAIVNREVAGLETVYLTAEPRLSYISSSMVKEMRKLGMSIDAYVPLPVVNKLNNIF